MRADVTDHTQAGYLSIILKKYILSLTAYFPGISLEPCRAAWRPSRITTRGELHALCSFLPSRPPGAGRAHCRRCPGSWRGIVGIVAGTRRRPHHIRWRGAGCAGRDWRTGLLAADESAEQDHLRGLELRRPHQGVAVRPAGLPDTVPTLQQQPHRPQQATGPPAHLRHPGLRGRDGGGAQERRAAHQQGTGVAARCWLCAVQRRLGTRIPVQVTAVDRGQELRRHRRVRPGPGDGGRAAGWRQGPAAADQGQWQGGAVGQHR
ncbi:hypothetical protein D3C76_940870 [compost metagenome]